MSTSHDPGRQVAAGNPWYVSDQFADQMGTPAGRKLVEGRWAAFGAAIATWSANYRGHEPLRMLDAGCGDGINLVGLRGIIQKMNRSVSLFGCDYNGTRINTAAKLEGLSGLYLASLLACPLPDETYDLVLCNHVIEHIREDDVALRELARILRPGGLLILGVPNEGCTMAQLRNGVLQPSIARTTDHVQFYTADSLQARARAAGFKTMSIRREGFFTPHMRLNALLDTAPGRALFDLLGSMLPSQAAGLTAFLTKA
jgi:SAM-dependent methyltransferase